MALSAPNKVNGSSSRRAIATASRNAASASSRRFENSSARHKELSSEARSRLSAGGCSASASRINATAFEPSPPRRHCASPKPIAARASSDASPTRRAQAAASAKVASANALSPALF